MSTHLAPQPEEDWNPLALLNNTTTQKPAETEKANAYVVFYLGGQMLAVTVSQVREILDDQPITPVPNAPHDVKGIIDVRGGDVAIVDLAQHLGIHSYGEEDNERIVVLEFAREGGPPLAIGMQSAAVRDVVRLPDTAITAPPKALGHWDQTLLRGVTRLDGNPLIVLDLHPLFRQKIAQADDTPPDDTFAFP